MQVYRNKQHCKWITLGGPAAGECLPTTPSVLCEDKTHLSLLYLPAASWMLHLLFLYFRRHNIFHRLRQEYPCYLVVLLSSWSYRCDWVPCQFDSVLVPKLTRRYWRQTPPTVCSPTLLNILPKSVSQYIRNNKWRSFDRALNAVSTKIDVCRWSFRLFERNYTVIG